MTSRKGTLTGVAAFALAVLAAVAVSAADGVAGRWMLTTENIQLPMSLEQQGRTVTGTLDYPHGAAFKLTGTFENGMLTFSGDSAGQGFTIQITSTARLGADGTLTGAINAHFVEFDDARQVRRTRDQVMPWNAARTPEK